MQIPTGRIQQTLREQGDEIMWHRSIAAVRRALRWRAISPPSRCFGLVRVRRTGRGKPFGWVCIYVRKQRPVPVYEMPAWMAIVLALAETVRRWGRR